MTTNPKLKNLTARTSANLAEKITTLAELISARERRKAITCPNDPSWRGPVPAAFVANMSGEVLHRLMAYGMWVYSRNKPSQAKGATITTP